MKIIITNDDGYGEPGLKTLEKAVAALGDITIVAPKNPQSFCGHRVTMRTPIHVEHPKSNHHIVHGSPADCARLAIKAFAPDADWLIAGINPGANLGSDVYQSGTVAAAREAAILNVKAIAISQYIGLGWRIEWPAIEWHATQILAALMKEPLTAGRYWNVNLPSHIVDGAPIPHTPCPLDKHPHDYRFSKKGDLYHYEGIIHDRPRSSGSDVDVCFNGAASMTLLDV